MTSRAELVSRIEQSFGKPKDEIRKLYPKMPSVVQTIVQENLRPPDKIYEYTQPEKTAPGFYRPPTTYGRFLWKGRNGEVMASFYDTFVELSFQPNKMRKRQHISGGKWSLSKYIHWVDCEFVEIYLKYFFYDL